MAPKNLRLCLSDAKKVPPVWAEKYSQIFKQVEEEYHRPLLILLCEILGILDEDPRPVFSARIYTSSDMFGGCAHDWMITTHRVVLHRVIDKEINESWQSVTENENTLTITGLAKDCFLDWQGGFADSQEISIGISHEEQAEFIEQAAKKLYKEVIIELLESDPKAKMRSELKRQHRFVNQITEASDVSQLDIYGKLLLDPDEDTAKGALDQLKPHLKANEASLVLPYFMTALKNVNKYVAHALIETAGFSMNPVFSTIIMEGLKHNESFVQEAACQWADFYFTAQTVALLIKLLHNQSDNLRWAAIASIGRVLSDKKANANEIKEIQNALIKSTRDNFRYVKAVAIELLGEIKAVKSLPEIIKALQDTDSYIRQTALRALEKMQETSCIVEIEKLIEDETETAVKILALKILKNLAGYSLEKPDIK